MIYGIVRINVCLIIGLSNKEVFNLELQTYKLIVKSDLYKTRYVIRAIDLKDASKKARVKFSRAYKVFGDKVKVSIDPSDLENHIQEILSVIHKTTKK